MKSTAGGAKKGKCKGKGDKAVKSGECFLLWHTQSQQERVQELRGRLFNPTKLADTLERKWTPRQAGGNLPVEKEQAR